MQFLSGSERDTVKLGASYGKKCKGKEVFLLSGELGGGKTQFTKGLATGLGIEDNIVSPTFTYEKVYKGPTLTLYHFDLYRENVLDADIEALLLEAIDDEKGVTVVEWAERLGRKKPKGATKVNFIWKSENERTISVK